MNLTVLRFRIMVSLLIEIMIEPMNAHYSSYFRFQKASTPIIGVDAFFCIADVIIFIYLNCVEIVWGPGTVRDEG